MLIRLHMWPVKSKKANNKDTNQTALVTSLLSEGANDKDANQTAHVTS